MSSVERNYHPDQPRSRSTSLLPHQDNTVSELLSHLAVLSDETLLLRPLFCIICHLDIITSVLIEILPSYHILAIPLS